MTVIKGSLIADIPKFHVPNKAEVAVVMIDPLWIGRKISSIESADKEIKPQIELYNYAKKMGFRTILVHNDPSQELKIFHEIGYPDKVLYKSSLGVLGDKESGKNFFSYCEKNQVTSLVVMGFHYEACVETSIMGLGRVDHNPEPEKEYSCYSGFTSCGYTVLTAPKLMSPYIPSIYKLEGFSPECVKFQEQRPDIYFDEHLKKRVDKKNPLWPTFTLHNHVRIYTSCS